MYDISCDLPMVFPSLGGFSFPRWVNMNLIDERVSGQVYGWIHLQSLVIFTLMGLRRGSPYGCQGF